MHVMAPLPVNPKCPMFFNVDSSVGNNGVNSNRTDILLVQFLIRKLSVLAAVDLTPDRRARMARVVVDGRSGPITIDGIRAVQEKMREVGNPGTVIDGRISSAHGLTYGSGSWTIASLNSALRKRTPSIWPRLHDIPDCPAELKVAIQKCL